jgi:hypothetical protein
MDAAISCSVVKFAIASYARVNAKANLLNKKQFTCAAIIANSCITAGIWEVFTTGRADISFFKLIDIIAVSFQKKKKKK